MQLTNLTINWQDFSWLDLEMEYIRNTDFWRYEMKLFHGDMNDIFWKHIVSKIDRKKCFVMLIESI